MSDSTSEMRVPPADDSDLGVGADRSEHRHDFDRFVVPARDLQGHSIPRYMHLQLGMDHQIRLILERRKFPYQGWGYFCRHALLRHIRWCQAIEPELVAPHLMTTCESIIELVQIEEFTAAIGEVLRLLESRISAYYEQGRTAEAARLLARANSLIAITTDSYWKEELARRFYNKFSPYGAPVQQS